MDSRAGDPLPPVLDAAQLTRIESLHRGFLYQHLYAVGCLLVAGGGSWTEIISEWDEDVELRDSGRHRYVQVKTRAERLVRSDIETTLARFAELRAAHTRGERSGTPEFVIVSNVEPGPELARDYAHASWPSDVVLSWPGGGSALADAPPAWPSVNHAIEWCTAHAERIPFSRIPAETLVWKLAGIVQHAATGGDGALPHRFVAADLSSLFEQVIVQLQEFPAAPTPYRPHFNEPDLDDTRTPMVVVGASGAGKSAWAAEAAQHQIEATAYFAVTDTVGEAFVPALARELAAQLVGRQPGNGAAGIFPGPSGHDALRGLSQHLGSSGTRATVFVDDVHRLSPDVVNQALQSAPEIRWVLLAQPGATATEVALRHGVAPAVLNGWGLDTIGAHCRAEGTPVDPETADRVRLLTGGLPLFVRGITQLAGRSYQGDLARCCDDLEAGTHLETTSQEQLLTRSIQALSPKARWVAGTLALAGIALSREEVEALVRGVGVSGAAEVALAVRELEAGGVLAQASPTRVVLHDSYRVLVPSLFAGAPDDARDTVQRALCAVLDQQRERGELPLHRVATYVRLLAVTGQTEELINLVGQGAELLREAGIAGSVQDTLAELTRQQDVPARDRYWLCDTLAFWALAEQQTAEAAEWIASMKHLLPASGWERERILLMVKEVQLCAIAGEGAKAGRLAEEVRDLVATVEPDVARVVRYNLAVAAFQEGDYVAVRAEASELAEEYFEELGLDPRSIVGASEAAVAEQIPDTSEAQRRVVWLAGCLDLYARASNACGKDSGLARIHAVKLYAVASAVRSAIKAGMDFVDECLAVRADATGARMAMEGILLPMIAGHGLLDYLMPVQAQYAVVLAYCGDGTASRALMEKVQEFALPEDPRLRAEIQGQARLIEEILNGQRRLT